MNNRFEHKSKAPRQNNIKGLVELCERVKDNYDKNTEIDFSNE